MLNTIKNDTTHEQTTGKNKIFLKYLGDIELGLPGKGVLANCIGCISFLLPL